VALDELAESLVVALGDAFHEGVVDGRFGVVFS